MEKIKFFLLMILITLLIGCGGGSTGSETDNVVIDNIEGETIDSSGGIIELSNGAKLTIPAESATTSTQVLFEQIDVPEYVGEKDAIAYIFVTSTELISSKFSIPLEFDKISGEEALRVIHIRGEYVAFDPIDFTYDPETRRINFTINSNWSFQNISEPSKQESILGVNEESATSSNNNDWILIAHVDSLTPINPLYNQKIIEMPFYEQSGGTCWAAAGKMLSKGFYSGNDAALKPVSIYSLMNNLGIGINDGLYSWHNFDFADALGNDVIFKVYVTDVQAALKKILAEIDKGHPLLFGRLNHVVMVVGYEVDTNGNIILIQHDSDKGMYIKQPWSEIMKSYYNDIIQEYFGRLTFHWSEKYPDPERPLQSVGIPTYPDSLFGSFYFEGPDMAGLQSVKIHLKFDETSEKGYSFSREVDGVNINKFPENINNLSFRLPIYNANAESSGEYADVQLNVSIWQDNNLSNRSEFSSTKHIYSKNIHSGVGDIDLIPLRKKLQKEEKFTVEISLETTLGITTKHIFNDFYLQPSPVIDSCITGTVWDRIYEDWNCDGYGDSLIDGASMTFTDDGLWTGVGPVSLACNGYWEKKYGTEEWVYIYYKHDNENNNSMMIGGIWSGCNKMQVDLTTETLRSIYGADCLVFQR